MNRVELAVTGIVGVKDEVDKPVGKTGFVCQLMEYAGVPIPAIQIQVGCESPGSLIEDVKRPVQLVHKKTALPAGRLLAQEIYSRKKAGYLPFAIRIARDRQSRVVPDFQNDLRWLTCRRSPGCHQQRN